MTRFAKRLAVAAIALGAVAFSAPKLVSAQEMLQRTDAYDFWSVFVDEAAPQKYCYAATVPTETRSSREGIRRGAVFLLVSSFPAANVANEVSVKLGFPADPNRPPTLEVDGRRFTMFSDNQEAWLENPGSDAQVVDAMRRGATAVLRSTSTRGTELTDTFSLIGFSKSIQRVGELCN